MKRMERGREENQETAGEGAVRAHSATQKGANQITHLYSLPFLSIHLFRPYVRTVPYVVSAVCVQWEGRRGKGYDGGKQKLKKLSSSG